MPSRDRIDNPCIVSCNSNTARRHTLQHISKAAKENHIKIHYKMIFLHLLVYL